MGLKEKLESLSNSQVYKLWNLWIYQNIAESESPSESEMIVELSDAVADDMIAMSELLADINNINKPKPTEGQCPKCGSNDLWHGDKTWHGDQFEQETTCNACEFEFQQWYTVKFDGVTTIDKDGEHIDIGTCDINKPNMKTENTKLLDFLQTSYNEYQANVLPLVPELYPAEGDDDVEFDAAKNEFLENLWDVVHQHFADDDDDADADEPKLDIGSI